MTVQLNIQLIGVLLLTLPSLTQPVAISHSLEDFNKTVDIFNNFWLAEYYQETDDVPNLQPITTSMTGWISASTLPNLTVIHHDDRSLDTTIPVAPSKVEGDTNDIRDSHFKTSRRKDKKEKRLARSNLGVNIPTIRFNPSEENNISKHSRKPQLCKRVNTTCSNTCSRVLRSLCSCHPSCTVYKNCCDDYDESCQAVDDTCSDKIKEHANSTIVCRGNNLLVSSCMQDFDEVMWDRMMTAKDMDYWWFEYLSYNTSSDSIQGRCQSNSSSEFLQTVPVGSFGIHYRNVFCAICNNAPAAEQLEGFLKCQDSDLKKVHQGIHTFVIYSNATDFLWESQTCQIFWWPREGMPNVCYIDDQRTELVLNQELLVVSKSLLKSPNNTRIPSVSSEAARESSLFYLADGSIRESSNFTFNDSESASQLLRRHRTLEISRNSTVLGERCKTIRPYICNPRKSGQPYKKHFCCQVWITDDKTPDFQNYTLPPHLQFRNGKNKTILRETEVQYSGLYYDAEYSNAVDALSQNVPFHSSMCNFSDEMHVFDRCLNISFRLSVVRKFTFAESRRYKGSFHDQVESFAKLTQEVMSTSLTNDTWCVAVHTKTKKGVGNNQWLSEILFNCTEFSSPNQSMTETPGQGHLHCNSDEFKRSIDFVTDRQNVIFQIPDAVTFPIELESTTCILKAAQHLCCRTINKSWQAVRVINPVIGSISIEGLITIICCSLSNCGLLCRLALQNTVPFYKSYPGKVQFSLCLTLLFSYTFFLIGGMVKDGSLECVVVSVLTHLAFLSALFWMNVTAFEIWRTFRHWSNQVVSRGNTSLMLSILYALGIPIVIVGCALLVEVLLPESPFCPAYGLENCWLNGSMSVAVFFVVPCSMICFANVVFVGLTLRGLRRQRTSMSEFKQSNAMTAVTDTTIVLKIVALVGITWLLGLLAAVVDTPAVWIIFTIINASLGFVISAVLVLNKRVFLAVQAKCLCYSPDIVTTTQIVKH